MYALLNGDLDKLWDVRVYNGKAFEVRGLVYSLFKYPMSVRPLASQTVKQFSIPQEDKNILALRTGEREYDVSIRFAAER